MQYIYILLKKNSNIPGLVQQEAVIERKVNDQMIHC